MKISFKWISAATAIILLLAVFYPPPLGALSVKEEEELGEEVLRVVLDRYEIVEDTYIRGYLNAVGRRILAHMPEQPFRYHFYVIKEHSYNAFAIPAGHVFINSGLFAAMESEEELAGILGHEIAHVYCRHISEKIARSKKIGLASLAGIAAGVLLGASGAGEAASAVTMGSAAAGVSAELAYSRDDEMQADQIGLKILTEASYNCSGLLKVLRKIRSKSWFDSEQFPTYLSTHPAVEDRLAYIDSYVATRSAAGMQPPPVDPDEFNRMVTRLRIKYGDESQMLDRYGSAVRESPQDPMANYHYGLILTEADRRGEAISYLKKALAQRAFDPYILRDLAKAYFHDGQIDPAIKLLQTVAGIRPKDPDTLFYLGRAHLESNRPAEATGFFTTLVEKEPGYRQAYYFLGKSLSDQGRPGEAAMNLGIFYQQGRDHRNAIMQFKQALKHIQDPVRREQIEARMKTSQKQLEAQKQQPG